MEYGSQIEVNGKRPVWLADDELCQPCWSDGRWYVGGLVAAKYVSGWNAVTKIRLPKEHWVNAVIEQGYWPWAGGDKAPHDWDGGEVLRRDGKTAFANVWCHAGIFSDIIGYKRKVVEKTGPMSADVPNELDALREKNAALEAQWADAIAKYPNLAPDPDHALKDEILAFGERYRWNIDYIEWDNPENRAMDLLYAWAKRHPAPVSKPCTLTPEELAQWRLEQARRIASEIWEREGSCKPVEEVEYGRFDLSNAVQSALAALTEYNITPETVK